MRSAPSALAAPHTLAQPAAAGLGNALGSIAAMPSAWRDRELPETWPDQQQNLWRRIFWFLSAPFLRRPLAELPPSLQVDTRVPEYAREAYHGLPNGYYSLNLVEGYDRGFELSMLGQVQPARARIATHLRAELGNGKHRILDIGTGSGRLAETLWDAGFDVWGLDPSPYMLQRAQRRTPGAPFVQGLIEQAPFPDSAFDGAGAFFVFHELPRPIASQALSELARILRPGALLCITDPCGDHINPTSLWRLLRTHGLRAVYFHALARFVYEPFLADWQSVGDYAAWFSAHGFEMLEQRVEIPFGSLVARRR